jgi:multiple sugar transport system permease protein
MPAASSTQFRRTDLAFLSPWLLTLALFWALPVLASFLLSFTDYRLLSGTFEVIGAENFVRLLGDPDFIKAALNTFIFTVGTLPFTTVFALLLAIFLNSNLPWRRFFQSVYFFPSIVSIVVIAIIFTSLYARGGYIQLLFDLAGLPYPEQGFLLSETTALPAIMAMDVWMATGYYMLLFLAALQAIPQELYESARIEGAGAWRVFRTITLPHLRPMLLFVVILNSIKSFQVFVEVFVMTKGGPLNATFTMVYFVYEEGLHKFNVGYGSAAAYLLFLVIAGISLLELRLIRSRHD